MPSTFDITPPASWSEESRTQYSRLPVWMSRTEFKAYMNWFRWKQLFPSLKWKQNSGDVMVTVRPVPSPIGSQVHRPRRMLENPLINKHQHTEQTQQATIRRHRYASDYLHWEGDFADFRDGQVKTQIEDLTRQIAFGDEFFIRDQSVAQARRMWAVGATGDGGYTENIPAGEATATDAVKTADFWAAQIARLGNQSLDFKNIALIRDASENDLSIPHWEGGTKIPAENEILKGKYILIGAGELYSRLTYDASVTAHRPLAMNLLNSRFKGVIGENIMFMAERYPIRFKSDGTMPAPEIEVEDPAKDYGTSKNTDIVVNPEYRDAPFGLAIFMGASPMKTIDVGPPPSEFAGDSITEEKFGKLNWNGQVRATRNIVRQDDDGNIDSNQFGDLIQLLAQTTHGALVEHPRFIVPILYRRDRFAAAAL